MILFLLEGKARPNWFYFFNNQEILFKKLGKIKLVKLFTLMNFQFFWFIFKIILVKDILYQIESWQ